MVRRHVAGDRQAGAPWRRGSGRATRPSRRASGAAARPARRRTTSARIARSPARTAPRLGRGRPAAQPEHGRDEAPRSPRRPSVSVGSSGWSTIGSPSAPAYASAFRRIAADRTGRAVVARTRPRRRRPARRARRALPCPAGRHRADRQQLDRRARRHGRRAGSRASTPGSSSAGVVFGIAQTVVNPPWAAAASPVAIGLGVLVAGLAQVRVEVDEARARRRRRRRRCRPRPRRRATSPPRGSPSRTTISPGPSRPAAGSTSQARLDVEVRHLAGSPRRPALCVPASR